MRNLYRHWIHRRERKLTLVDTNRRVFPFSWGLDWIGAKAVPGTDPSLLMRRYARKALQESERFFAAPELRDFSFRGGRLEFPSPLPGPDPYNNLAAGRLFEADSDRAVVVVPQWNADAGSHLALCRLLKRLGVTALRLCLPYHEQRRPAGMERADYMVSPNIGRTLQATRQAVMEVRQAAGWLRGRGYRRVGVLGTSVGSCVCYLAFVHDRQIHTAVFNHVSGLFADVVWTGLSTRYVRWGLQGHLTLPVLRRCWAPISPLYYVGRLQGDRRRHLLITARFDLSFLPELTERVFAEYESRGVSCDRVDLPCGHYTTARFPFKYVDGWHICRYLTRALDSPAQSRLLRERDAARA